MLIDQIAAAVCAELEQRRQEIDADRGLASLTVVVQIRNQEVGDIIFRKESRRRKGGR
jgi:MinD-like ATPase involved in chromosome partitioning or flagellar assembly